MEALLQKLKDYGCDIDGALDRMAGDSELLVDCITLVTQDNAINELEKNLASGDLTSAFDSAHTLKGICGNTGITPLYVSISKIVEVLRAGKDTHLEDEFFEFKKSLKNLTDLLEGV
ncbi:Hpt domain-containing protein [Eubacterium sp.]|uniref:Hpt domain-containing protein n=1 Tax=Eubacterium sp. TaxID=142586 RepID=UPI002FC5BD98